MEALCLYAEPSSRASTHPSLKGYLALMQPFILDDLVKSPVSGHYEERSDESLEIAWFGKIRLLRYARNDSFCTLVSIGGASCGRP